MQQPYWRRWPDDARIALRFSIVRNSPGLDSRHTVWHQPPYGATLNHLALSTAIGATSAVVSNFSRDACSRYQWSFIQSASNHVLIFSAINERRSSRNSS
jgi:hypothetical protein